MSKLFQGIIPPMITPFDEQGDLSEGRLRSLVDRLVESGVDGLFPCGSIGEFSNMSTGEIERATKIVVNQTAGRVPVLMGTGASGTGEALALTEKAAELGVDGVIVVTPFYMPYDQKSIQIHFQKVAESTDLPVLVYHIPQFTGQELAVETICKLEEEQENIVGLKDSSGDLAQAGEIISKTSPEFMYFQGLDSLLLSSLVLGADGGVNGTANVEPSFVLEVFNRFVEGDLNSAMEAQTGKVNKLVEVCSVGPFPEGFKSAARLCGIDLGVSRAPVYSLSEEQISLQKQQLQDLNLI